jgi:hypothetical protein
VGGVGSWGDVFKKCDKNLMRNKKLQFFTLIFTMFLSFILPLKADTIKEKSEELELNPEIIENSPVLQRWLQEIPDVLKQIQDEPSFRTRIRFGYSQFPSNNNTGGINVGVEDIFINKTGLTLSGEYYTDLNKNSDRLSVSGNLHYYILPLGNYVNIAPVVGYRYIQTNGYNTDGINVGARLVLALSPDGAADIFITQTFMSPGSNNEVGITNISAGYALTENLRLATDIEWQNSVKQKDNRFGIGLEWMP